MTAKAVPAHIGWVRDWPRWTPYAAAAWSLGYAALGLYWAVSGQGFPYSPALVSGGGGSVVGQLGTVAAWIIVIMAGLPAAVMGAAMVRAAQNRALRILFMVAGALLSGILLLLMTDLNLLVTLGYTPISIVKLLSGDAFGQVYLNMLTQWTTIHQLLCLAGGFLWLGATVSFARRSGGACLYCGRRDGVESWQRPDQAARWGRTAVFVSMVAPVFYAFTRYAWALGVPLGMSQEAWRSGQERGMWISGLFLATFGLVGALLTLGLIQRWGEVFPRWMIGLAGRRVPIALAVIPAALVSVLLIVGGINIWSGLPQMTANLAAEGVKNVDLFWGIFFQLGGTLLFPVWGAALAVAALGYYYRRRGACNVCGRGTPGEASQPETSI